MGFAAIGLSMLGFAIGVLFRLRLMLLAVALLLLTSIVFSVSRGFNFLDTAVMVMAAQTILQGSYFLGLVARTMFSAHRVRHIL